jgi:ABC-type transporter Mla subunit MlaD
MGLLNDLLGGLSRADKDQLNRIEGILKTMSADFEKVKTKIQEVSDGVTAGFQQVTGAITQASAGVSKEVIETATLVKELRDRIIAGVVDEATVQNELDGFFASLTGIASKMTASTQSAVEAITGAGAQVAQSLDAIQNPPASEPESPTEPAPDPEPPTEPAPEE